METVEHNFQRLVFNPANQKLIDFSDDLQKQAENAFGVAAQVIIEQFNYNKMSPHLNNTIDQVHLKNGSFELIASILEGS